MHWLDGFLILNQIFSLIILSLLKSFSIVVIDYDFVTLFLITVEFLTFGRVCDLSVVSIIKTNGSGSGFGSLVVVVVVEK